jgi:hypothetical protein
LRRAGGGEFGDVVAGRRFVSRCRSSL